MSEKRKMSEEDPRYVTKEICDAKMEALRAEIRSIKWVIVTTISLSTTFITVILLLLR